jgi:hypothetical protein
MGTRRIAMLGAVVLALGVWNTQLVFAQEPDENAPVSGASVPKMESMDPEIVVPEGTVLPIVLSVYLNTRNSQPGDNFYADTVYPIWIQQRLVIPRGSIVKGTVTDVVRPGRIKGKGRIAVRFDDILLPNGIRRDLNAAFHGIHGPGDEKVDRQSESLEGGDTKGTDAGQVIGTTSQGAIIGAIAGRGEGAAIGAGAGAAVGLATVLFTRGRDLVLEPGTQFDMELRQPLRFAYGELDFTAAEMEGARRVARPAPRAQRPENVQPRLMPGRVWGLPIPRF